MTDKLKAIIGSRKWLLVLAGAVYAVLTVFKEQLGVSLDPQAVVMALVLILVYIFGEGKQDMKRIKDGLLQQDAKWKDPKFWISIAGAFLPVITEVTGLKLPVDMLNGGLAVVLGMLFKKGQNTA